jgi:hypothetical protein
VNSCCTEQKEGVVRDGPWGGQPGATQCLIFYAKNFCPSQVGDFQERKRCDLVLPWRDDADTPGSSIELGSKRQN